MRFSPTSKLIFLMFLFGASLIVNITFGQVQIPFETILKSLTGQQTGHGTWEYIILNYRLPKALTAILVGVGLSISGLLMQTLFRNPLAGPYVLGLSSGSSLAVALMLLGSGFLPFFSSSYSIITASCLGSVSVLALLLFVSNKIKDTHAILIIGLMFSSLTSAIISVLSYFSTAEQLQRYTFWSMGSISNLSWQHVGILFLLSSLGLAISLFSIKSLDALLLGENYARSIGLNFNQSKLIIIVATSILTGSITAFAGPIAFIGLAIPHLSKILFQTSQHKILFSSTILFGAIVMLLCDTVAQMPGLHFTLPINAITSLLGAPVVIYLITKQKKWS